MRNFLSRNKNRDQEELEVENDQQDQDINEDRKIASVNKGLGIQSRLTSAVVGTAVVAFMVWFLWGYYSDLWAERQARKDRTVDTTQTAQTNLKPLNISGLESNQQTQPNAAPPAPNLNQPQQAQNGQPVKSPAQIEREERLSSNVKFNLTTQQVNSQANASGGQPGQPGQPGQTGQQSSGQQGNAPGAALSNSLQGAQMDPVQAYSMGDGSLMVYQGEAIPCTVQQAIDSSLVGQVTCVQTRDLWSADHSAIVAERGTIYTGQQLTGLARGNRRLPIVWVRGRTPFPNNVGFNLNSAATDELGRTGITGEIDSHIAERFGPIVALSIIDDIGDYYAATGQKGGGDNTNISFGNTTSGGQNLASDIFKEAANIPSTLTRNQGANIYIYLARDVDFSTVYNLEYKE